MDYEGYRLVRKLKNNKDKEEAVIEALIYLIKKVK
jgi:hypothetical protein